MHTKECLWLFSSVLKLRGSSVQFSSVAQSYLFLTLCNPMDCSTPGIHVHWVGDAIQPSHPLSTASPPAFNLSRHQGLFKWISSLHQVAKVLEFQLQHQSFQEYSGLISFRIDWFDLLAVQGLSRAFSCITVQKH